MEDNETSTKQPLPSNVELDKIPQPIEIKNRTTKHDNHNLNAEIPVDILTASEDVLYSKESDSMEMYPGQPDSLIREPKISRERFTLTEISDKPSLSNNASAVEHKDQTTPSSDKHLPNDSDEFIRTTSVDLNDVIQTVPALGDNGSNHTKTTTPSNLVIMPDDVNGPVTQKGHVPALSSTHVQYASVTVSVAVAMDNQSASTKSPVISATTNATLVVIDDVIAREPVATLASVSDHSPHKAAIVVPVMLGLIALILVLVVLVRKRRATRRRSGRKTNLKEDINHEEQLLPQEGSGPVYAKVDVSKKRKTGTTPMQEIEMLQLIPNDHENCRTVNTHSCDVTPVVAPQKSPTSSVHRYDALDSVIRVDERLGPAAMVEHDLYESTHMLHRHSSSAEQTDPQMSLDDLRRTRANEMRASKDLPPLPQCIGAHSEDTYCPVCSGSAPSSEEDEDTDSQYLAPTCHDHPAPGPGWKPFHPYDPVYVPTSSAGAMDRRVDSTGYVSRPQPQSQVYEEINYTGLRAQPVVARMTMGATASGGRPAPRMLPVTPRGSYGTDTGPYGLTAIAGLSVTAANNDNAQTPASTNNTGAHGDTSYNDSTYQTVSTHNVPVNTHTHTDLNECTVDTAADSSDVTSQNRDSRASSTVSSNRDEAYETVEFPDPNI